jgi:hypothetical protein
VQLPQAGVAEQAVSREIVRPYRLRPDHPHLGDLVEPLRELPVQLGALRLAQIGAELRGHVQLIAVPTHDLPCRGDLAAAHRTGHHIGPILPGLELTRCHAGPRIDRPLDLRRDDGHANT